jgi:hypothetical protein
MDDEAASPDLGQDDEVRHVPMKDARRPKVAQILEIEAERAGREADLLGVGSQALKGGSTRRRREPLAKRHQVGAVSVKPGDR